MLIIHIFFIFFFVTLGVGSFGRICCFFRGAIRRRKANLGRRLLHVEIVGRSDGPSRTERQHGGDDQARDLRLL